MTDRLSHSARRPPNGSKEDQVTDDQGIHHLWLNDTIHFYFDESIIRNSTFLLSGEYSVQIRAYDAAGNFCQANLSIIIEDPVSTTSTTTTTTSTTTTSTTSTTTTTTTEQPDDTLMIIGIIGGAGALVIIIIIVALLKKKGG